MGVPIWPHRDQGRARQQMNLVALWTDRRQTGRYCEDAIKAEEQVHHDVVRGDDESRGRRGLVRCRPTHRMAVAHELDDMEAKVPHYGPK
jgi:hypothetical protein